VIARRVGANGPRVPTEEAGDALAFELPAQIPERGVEPRERAVQMRPRELVLPFRDLIDEGLDI